MIFAVTYPQVFVGGESSVKREKRPIEEQYHKCDEEKVES